jgi:mannose-1-phosphate guanylyltransferase
MQMHHHRAEHWVILAGTGQVTVNGKQFLLTENQSTFIPIGAEHCLKPGPYSAGSAGNPVRVLPGEDDIIRIKDQYGRC